MTDWRSDPSTGLRHLHFRSLSLPPESPPTHYMIPVFILCSSVSLFAGDIKFVKIGGGVAPGGGDIFQKSMSPPPGFT